MYYLFIMRQVCLHCVNVCLHWKNPRFTAFLDSNLHTRLAIVTTNELGLAFPPRNLPNKFRPDPSTFYLVFVVTDKQTERQLDRQTYTGDYIIPRESFRGDKYYCLYCAGCDICWSRNVFSERLKTAIDVDCRKSVAVSTIRRQSGRSLALLQAE